MTNPSPQAMLADELEAIEPEFSADKVILQKAASFIRAASAPGAVREALEKISKLECGPLVLATDIAKAALAAPEEAYTTETAMLDKHFAGRTMPRGSHVDDHTFAEEASIADPQTLCGMIAGIYGSLDAEDCARIDREWAKMRGYILPSAGASEAVAWGRVIDGKAVTVSLTRTVANDEPLYAAPPAAQTDDAPNGCSRETEGL